MKFKNATEAFDMLYLRIKHEGVKRLDTKTLFNVGFYLEEPMDNIIRSKNRNFNTVYAEREWSWYESKDPSAIEISKYAPIWKNHMDENGKVNSNYGWQLDRNEQLNKVVEILKKEKHSRQAVVSIYDGKEMSKYKYDTPCTNSIHFQIVNEKLCMTVNMRSNDLWYGFCNDQYCFSKIQEKVSNILNVEIGWYYHFASNIHLYDKQL